MRGKGVAYDTGFIYKGSVSRERFDPGVVRRELASIRDDLHCNAVKVIGGDPGRLEPAARHAAELWLEVWFSPSHLVFVTKHRHPVFSGRHIERLEEIMRDVCTDFECELAEFNGEANHAPPLVNFPPKVTLPRLVNSPKGVSSRRMRQEFPDLRRHCWRANRLWSASYFAGPAGGAPVTVLGQYIEQQNLPAPTSAEVRPPSPPA